MGMVMIMCPKTGRPVPTGFGMDKESFKNPTVVLSQNSFGPCPACGGMHTWDKKDGWVME